MKVDLTPDQMAFVRMAVESGRLRDENDAVREAMALWEERERARMEIMVAVDRAEASLAHGAGRAVTEESLRDVASEVKARGRARLSAKPPSVS